MVEMRARSWFGLLVTVVVTGIAAACVPQPANRPTPPGGGDAPTSPGLSTHTVASIPPVPSPSPSFIRPTPNPSPTFLAYEVRSGDSLTSIARLFGTTARSIAFWNRATYPSLDPDSEAYEPNRIEVGWTLLLIPTEVVAEDELPDPTPTPASTTPESSSVGANGSPS